jgi:hypothetical protein
MREIFDLPTEETRNNCSNVVASGQFSPLGGIPIAIGTEGKGVGLNMFNQKRKEAK